MVTHRTPSMSPIPMSKAGPQDLSASLSSLLHLEPVPEQPDSVFQYDRTSHIASLAHTSHLKYQRATALSSLAKEQAAAKRYRQQTLRLAAGLAVRDARLERFHASTTTLAGILGNDGGNVDGRVLEICASRARELLGDYRKSMDNLSESRDAEERLKSEIGKAQNQLEVLKDKKKRADKELKDSIQLSQRLSKEICEREGRIEFLETENIRLNGISETQYRSIAAMQADYEHQLQENCQKLLESEGDRELKCNELWRSHNHSKLLQEKLDNEHKSLQGLKDSEDALRLKIVGHERVTRDLENANANLLQEINVLKESHSSLVAKWQQLETELRQEKKNSLSLMRTETGLRNQIGEHQLVINHMESRVANLTNAIEASKAESGTDISALEMKLSKTTSLLAQAELAHREQIVSLMSSEDNLKIALQAALKENSVFRRSLEAYQDDMTALKSELSALRSDTASLEATLKNHIEASDKKAVEAERLISELQEKLKNNEALRRTYNLTINSLRSKMNHLRFIKKTTVQQLRQAQARESDLSKLQMSLGNQLTKAHAEIKASKEIYHTAESRSADSEADLASQILRLNQDLEKTRAGHSSARLEIDRLRESTMSANSQLKNATLQLQTLEHKNASLTSDNSNLEVRLSNMRKLVTEHEEALLNKESQITDLTALNEKEMRLSKEQRYRFEQEMEHHRSSYVAKVAQLQERIDAAEAQSNMLRDRLAAAESVHGQDSDKRASTASENSATSIQSADSGMSSHIATITTLEAENHALRRASGIQIQRVQDLEASFNMKEETVSTLASKLAIQESTLTDLRRQLGQYQTTSSETQKSIATLSEKVKQSEDKTKYWRKLAEERDLYIIELESFQRGLRGQLATGQKDRNRSGRNPRPISSALPVMPPNRRVVSDSTRVREQTNGELGSRIRNVRLSSFPSTHFEASEKRSVQEPLLPIDLSPLASVKTPSTPVNPSPLSSRGRDSTLSEAKTRIGSSHGIKAFFSRPKSRQGSFIHNLAGELEQIDRLGTLDIDQTLQKKPSLLWKLSHVGSMKKRTN